MQHDLEQEQAAARLRALPDEQQPYGWAEFQRRAALRVKGHPGARPVGCLRASPLMMVTTAAAAGLVLAIIGVTLWDRVKPLASTQMATRSEPVADGQRASGEPWRGLPRRESGALHRASGAEGPDPGAAAAREERVAALERWLATLPDDPALVRVGSRAAVAGLEDRIAQLDDEISTERVLAARPTRLQAIQQERAQLVSSLAQVRYAETLAAESP